MFKEEVYKRERSREMRERFVERRWRKE